MPPIQAILRETIETLAPIDRTPGSDGEREAAEWIAERFRRAGCEHVLVQDEPTWGPFPPTIVGLGVAGLVGGVQVARGRRSGALLSLASVLGLLDEIQNGPRVLRRLVRKQKTTTNVVATFGDESAERTLVVLAHHDAAQTGRIFDQAWAQSLHRVMPDVMQRAKTQVPQWWIGIVPGLLSTVAAATGSKRASRWGLGLGALGLAAVADIGRSPTVPGANDNLSGVAVQVALAEHFKEASPPPGMRVVLASCGAEETLQDGIRAFMTRHRSSFSPGKTWFLNFDTVGSSHLVLLEGEGPAWMEEYADPSFRDLISDCASEAGISVERGIRARASTDSIIPSRQGFPTATLVSLMPWRMPGNYHLMSDTPENVDYGTVEECVHLTVSVLGRLPTL